MKLPTACCILLTGCFSYQEVTLKGITDVSIEQMDQNGVSAQVTVRVDNPNAFRIRVGDPDVDLFLNDSPIGKASIDSTVVLEKRTEREYVVPLRASFNGGGLPAMGALLSAAFGGKVRVKASGTVTAQALLLRKKIPFEAEHELDLGR